MATTKLCTKKMITFFKAGGDEHRQRILQLLSKYKSLNGNQLLEYLEISQPTLSHHLKILRDAELVIGEKRGKEVFFTLNSRVISDCCKSFEDQTKN